MNIIGIILAEGYREFMYFKRYSLERLSSTVMLIFIFLGFVYSSADLSNGTVHYDTNVIAHKAIGFLVWFFALDAVGHLSSAIREDMHIGILEQIALSPYPLIYNMFGRSISRFFINLSIAIVMFVLFSIFFNLKISFKLSVFPVFILTYAGLYGLGLIFAGLTLVFKRLGPVTTIVRFFLLIFTGAIIPLSVFPDFMQKTALFIPMTSGLTIMKAMIFENMQFTSLVSERAFFYLILNTTFYLSVGIFIFSFFERQARKKGALGTY
ncbi:MAG: hypothetical protein OHK0040_05180 [bacterium]